MRDTIIESGNIAAIWGTDRSSRWPLMRLKWSSNGVVGGIWGNDPDDDSTVVCVRVADFDRTRLIVVNDPPTKRSFTESELDGRLLEPNDLLIEKSGGGSNQPVGCVVRFNGNYKAVCSNFIAKLTLKKEHDARYWTYLHSAIYSARLNTLAIKQTTGIQNLDIEQYLSYRVAVPAVRQQKVIADYLDRETAKIDALIAAKSQFLKLLSEKRQALITHAVTRGVNPHTQLRDSGVEWIDRVPAHWRSTKVRWLFRLVKRQDYVELPVLSVYRDYGVIFRDSRDDNANRVPDDLTRYQLVEIGDLVINKMKAWQGSLGISQARGITSPDYVVFTPTHHESSDYLNLLLRNSLLTTAYLSMSNGIRTSQWRLEPDRFGTLEVFLPPVEEQIQIVAQIDKKLSLIDQLSKGLIFMIEMLGERRRTLIATAVTGGLESTLS